MEVDLVNNVILIQKFIRGYLLRKNINKKYKLIKEIQPLI